MAGKKISFEQAMLRLEEIVGLLERGEASLEQSLALFEEGTKLMHVCSAQLDSAEQKVALLKVNGRGEPEQVPFDVEE